MIERSLRALLTSIALLSQFDLAWSQSDTQNDCISLDRKSNSIADFLVNRCAFKVNVLWRDEGLCHNWCAETVRANDRASVTKSKGLVNFGVCRSPATPIRDRSGNSFDCRN